MASQFLNVEGGDREVRIRVRNVMAEVMQREVLSLMADFEDEGKGSPMKEGRQPPGAAKGKQTNSSLSAV